MSFILKAKNGESVQINAWNWRPTIELLLHAGLIDAETHERMGYQACDGHADEQAALRIADFLDEKLKTMTSNDRIRADLSITDKPKELLVITPSTKLEDIDANEAFSAKYEWLLEFAGFARRSGGFEVF